MLLQKAVREARRALQFVSADARRRYAIQHRLTHLFQTHYWQDVAGSAGATVEDLGGGFRRIQRGVQSTIVLQGNVMLDDWVTLKLAGDKALVYRLLSEIDVACPEHCVITPSKNRATNRAVVQAALSLLEKGEVVVKPVAGTGAGRGVTTHVRTERELRRAVRTAQLYGDRVLVERFVHGRSFRLLFLDGQCLDAIVRHPPAVQGDGRHTIAQLIGLENARRAQADPPVALSFITLDEELDYHLRSAGLNRTSVLENQQIVTLKSVVNQNNASENERVIDRIHPSVISQCLRICRKLRIHLAGVDLIAETIEQPWEGANIIVNEVNTTPGLHHHVLTSTGSDHHRVGVPLLNHLLELACDH